jgi:hypothetical protein
MAQHGQVLKLKGNDRNGNAVWAYRYRLNGRGSKRGPGRRIRDPR